MRAGHPRFPLLAAVALTAVLLAARDVQGQGVSSPAGAAPAVTEVLERLSPSQLGSVEAALAAQLQRTEDARSALRRSGGTVSFQSIGAVPPTIIGLPASLSAAERDRGDTLRALNIVRGLPVPPANPGLAGLSRAEETIVNLLRPIWLVCDGRVWASRADPEQWSDSLTTFANAQPEAMRSVGRLDLFAGRRNPPAFVKHLGSAVAVHPRLIVTNRHVVAEFIGEPRPAAPFLMPEGFHVRFNIAAEYENCPSFVQDSYVDAVAVAAINWSDDPADDAAIIVLGSDLPLPPARLAATRPPNGTKIVVIGFPGEPSLVGTNFTRPQLEALFRAPEPPPPALAPTPFYVRRISPGFTSATPGSASVLNYNANTNFGSSGSPVFNLATGDMVALHIGGGSPGLNQGVVAVRLAPLLALARDRIPVILQATAR